MSSQQNKLQRERNQKQLLELVALPGNNICADCKTRNPRWASHNIGIFICMHCASIHRKIGTHVTKVKSLTMDDWTKEQVETMRSMGNIKSNSIYNPNELRYPPPPNLEDSERDGELEQYIRSKYQYKKFLDKSALAASKLGPSRSVSSVVKSSQTLPAIPTKSSTSSASLHQATANSAANSTIPQRPANVTSVNVKAPGNPSPASGIAPSTARSGGVWNDLCSLTSPGHDSSLPLQFQAPSQSPMLGVNGSMNFNGYSPVGGFASNGMMANPFQAQQVMNSFSQQPLSSNYPYVSTTPALTNWTPTTPQPTTPIMPQPISATTSFFQPQHQTSLQVQMPSSPGILSHSPSGLPVMSPAMQTHFLTPSPSQQLHSHSPQLVGYQTGLPSQASFALQSTPVMSATQFGVGVGPNMGLGLNTGSMPTTPMGQAGFLSTTTMQMQQQQILMQQQAQQQQLAQHQQQQLGSYMFATQSQMQQPYAQSQQWGPM